MMKNAEKLLVSISLCALAGIAGAQDLPKRGTISWHTGWQFTGEVMNVAEGHIELHGKATGTSFNDTLH